MKWHRYDYGFWCEDTHLIIKGYVSALLTVEQFSWQTIHDLTATVANSFGMDTAKITQKIPTRGEDLVKKALHHFMHIFRKDIGRDPSWIELVNHLAEASKSLPDLNVPDELGNVGDSTEIKIDTKRICYICGKGGSGISMVRFSSQAQYTHKQCLSLENGLVTELELDDTLLVELAKLSIETNLPVTCVINRALRILIMKEKEQLE